MKTIGIITYHHYYNYGTVLQAYALQKAIEQGLNCESEIIDYRFSEEKKISLFQLIILRLRRIFIYIFEIKRVWRLITQQKILQTIFIKQKRDRNYPVSLFISIPL